MKKILTILLSLTLLFALAACGNQAEPADPGPAKDPAPATEPGGEEKEPDEVMHVIYAFPGTAARLNYVNDDGSYGGYEIDIVQELDRRLEDVEFELYCTGEFSSLTPGLDAGKFDMVGSNITWKQERAENYLYSTVPYIHTPYALAVSVDNTDITSIEDLCGRRMVAIPGTGATLFLEAFNEQHPDNPIQLDYIESNSVDNIAMMLEGRCDACFANVSDYAIAEEERGYKVKILDLGEEDTSSVGEEPDGFFLFRKEHTELQEKVDKCLTEMREDGTLSELCLKYYIEDFSVLPEGYTGYIH